MSKVKAKAASKKTPSASKSKAVKTPRRKSPLASRPYMPGYGIPETGSGLVSWSLAVKRLTAARNYWIATTRPDGRPHAMPVWGVWLEDRFWFSTGQQSRKARNLAQNPRCVVCAEPGNRTIIVEGIANLITEKRLLKRFGVAYQAKYDWDMEGFDEPIYVVVPIVAFAFTSDDGQFTKSATRWKFSEP